MYVDISNDDILMNDSLGFFLGIPKTKAVSPTAVATTVKIFDVPNAPIYPKRGLGFLPTVDDLIAYTRKTSTGVTPVTTDTILAASKINTITDPASGDDIYGAVEFASAPATADADSIVFDYVEELQPFVAQDITPTLKTATKDVGRMYSTDTMKGYGNVTIGIKSEQVMGKSTIKYIEALLFKESEETADTGCRATDMRKKPLNLYAYTPMIYEDEILGRLYYESVTLEPDLPGGKQGDTLGFTINANVAKMPRLVIPDAAV